MKNVLISFVGTNDNNRIRDGAILTVFKEENIKYNEVHLLYNNSKFINLYEIADYVRSEILKRRLCENVKIHLFYCDDVTDHNEIYPKLQDFCISVYKDGTNYTAAIASGTPSMQACWILLSESGDFPLRLIRSDDRKWGKPVVREVKLGTALPRIMRLEEENKQLKKSLLQTVTLNVKRAELKIGNVIPELSPVEFAYYRYFLERAFKEMEYLRIDVDETPKEFYDSINKFHRESFPQADSNRIQNERNKTIASSTFRSNVSKLNSKIKNLFDDKAVSYYYQIESKGKRFSKSYGIGLPKEKIKIIK